MRDAQTECADRRTHDYSRAVTDEGRGLNDARVATHRTRLLLFLWGTKFDPTRAMVSAIDTDQWRALVSDERSGANAANGRRWPQMAYVRRSIQRANLDPPQPVVLCLPPQVAMRALTCINVGVGHRCSVT